MSSRAVAVQVLQYALLRLARVLQSVEAYGPIPVLVRPGEDDLVAALLDANEPLARTAPRRPRGRHPARRRSHTGAERGARLRRSDVERPSVEIAPTTSPAVRRAASRRSPLSVRETGRQPRRRHVRYRSFGGRPVGGQNTGAAIGTVGASDQLGCPPGSSPPKKSWVYAETCLCSLFPQHCTSPAAFARHPCESLMANSTAVGTKVLGSGPPPLVESVKS